MMMKMMMTANSDIQDKKEGYLGNPNIKRDGVVQTYSKHQFDEYKKCAKDPIYFIETYVKVIHLDHGLVPFKLYDYQRKMIKHFKNNRFSIVLACRQSGKSIGSVGFLLWYAVFHSGKNIAMLANKGSTAREMLGRFTLALENLPFFLQPGCKYLNKGSIKFSTNTRVFAAATSSSSIRGESCNIIFLDEFGFVNNAAEFYTSTYPVISSGKSTKVIITSTANRTANQFYHLWQGALQGENEFKPFRVDWWNVPGRDEEWKKQTIKNTSELQFKQEFGNAFIGISDTLIEADALLQLKGKKPIRVTNAGLYVYEEPIEDHDYVMCVDVSKGRGKDYSTFTIMDVSVQPFKQVCIFRNNKISPLLFPEIINSIGNYYNEAFLLVESNDAGVVVCNALYYDYEYDNMFVESSVKKGGVGITMTKSVKRIGCSNLKDLVEMGKIEIVDIFTIDELISFESKGNSYAAADGAHDDLAMNLVLFSWFISSDLFQEDGLAGLKELIYREKLEQLENEMLPPIAYSNGLEDYENNENLSKEMQDLLRNQDIWKDDDFSKNR